MDSYIANFAKIAKFLRDPLVLSGFAIMLILGVHETLIKNGIIPKLSTDQGSIIVQLLLLYGFWLGVLIVVLGFGLQFYKTHKNTEIIKEADKSSHRNKKITSDETSAKIQLTKQTIEKINTKFSGYFELFQILTEFPVLKDTGIYQSELDIQDSIKKHITQLTVNDPHALLNHPTNYFDSPVTFHYKTTDFATICALREIQEKPQIISAGVVAINEEKRILFLHRRSEISKTYANALHIIGGGYAPPGANHRIVDTNLKSTMHREFKEELDIQVSIPKNINILFGKESDTGFIQIVALGATVNSHDIDEIQANWEGDIVLLKFDDLFDKLTDKNEFWVPSGKAHILTWLALGAPNCHPNTKFSGYSAKELFDKIIGKLELNL